MAPCQLPGGGGTAAAAGCLLGPVQLCVVCACEMQDRRQTACNCLPTLPYPPCHVFATHYWIQQCLPPLILPSPPFSAGASKAGGRGGRQRGRCRRARRQRRRRRRGRFGRRQPGTQQHALCADRGCHDAAAQGLCRCVLCSFRARLLWGCGCFIWGRLPAAVLAVSVCSVVRPWPGFCGCRAFLVWHLTALNHVGPPLVHAQPCSTTCWRALPSGRWLRPRSCRSSRWVGWGWLGF